MALFFTKHTTSRSLILASFSFVIILMTLLIIISFTEFTHTSSQLQSIVNVNNYKQKLVEEMHISAFKRVSSLQRLILLNDPFEQDEEAMFIDRQGSIFTDARMRLLKTALNENEVELLKTQGDAAKISVPTIHEIINQLHIGNTLKAQALLQNKLIPAQTIIFNALSELQVIQEDNIKYAFATMTETYTFSRYYMLTLGLIAACLSIFIAILTYNKVRFAERQLSTEKERAQITLQNIVDGVITTNHLGDIDFINPTAAALTAWPVEQAVGQPLLTVLNLADTKLQQVCSSFEEFLLSDKKELILIAKSGEKIAIEHNTSAIPSSHINNKSIVVTFRNVTKERELTQTLSYQATHDPLTGTFNRMAFEENLSSHIRDSRNKNQYHVLCFLDLDHFKQVNDSAGHIAGDEMLKQVTKIFLKHIRNSDFLARIGGDEFAIILESCDTDKALDITEDIRNDIHQYIFEWEGQPYQISVSIGITIIDKTVEDMTQVLEQADQACYMAKESGKNLIKLYTERQRKRPETEEEL